MTRPASHQHDSSQGPAGCHPGMLMREEKGSALPLFCYLCLESGSLYRCKPDSKKNAQLIFARHSGFSISTSLMSQIFQFIYSHSRMEPLEKAYSLTEISSK